MTPERKLELEHRIMETISELTNLPITGIVLIFECAPEDERAFQGVAGIGKLESDFAQLGALHLGADIVLSRFKGVCYDG